MAVQKIRFFGNIAPVSASSQLMIRCGITRPSRWGQIVPNANPSDKIIQKLENFPELVEALRSGNQVRARLLFAQLFEGETDDRREAQVPSSAVSAPGWV